MIINEDNNTNIIEVENTYNRHFSHLISPETCKILGYIALTLSLGSFAHEFLMLMKGRYFSPSDLSYIGLAAGLILTYKTQTIIDNVNKKITRKWGFIIPFMKTFYDSKKFKKISVSEKIGNKEKNMHYSYHVFLEGEGEKLELIGTPQQGKANTLAEKVSSVLENEGTTVPLDATNNWWGTASPDFSNTDLVYETSVGNYEVDVDPWATSAFPAPATP